MKIFDQKQNVLLIGKASTITLGYGTIWAERNRRPKPTPYHHLPLNLGTVTQLTQGLGGPKSESHGYKNRKN